MFTELFDEKPQEDIQSLPLPCGHICRYRYNSISPWLCLECSPPVAESRIRLCELWSDHLDCWELIRGQEAATTFVGHQNIALEDSHTFKCWGPEDSVFVDARFESFQMASTNGWLRDDLPWLLCGPSKNQLEFWDPVPVRADWICPTCLKRTTKECCKV